MQNKKTVVQQVSADVRRRDYQSLKIEEPRSNPPYPPEAEERRFSSVRNFIIDIARLVPALWSGGKAGIPFMNS